MEDGFEEAKQQSSRKCAQCGLTALWEGVEMVLKRLKGRSAAPWRCFLFAEPR